MDSSNFQHGSICGIGAITHPIALCLALFLNRLRPYSNPFRLLFEMLVDTIFQGFGAGLNFRGGQAVFLQ